MITSVITTDVGESPITLVIAYARLTFAYDSNSEVITRETFLFTLGISVVNGTLRVYKGGVLASSGRPREVADI